MIVCRWASGPTRGNFRKREGDRRNAAEAATTDQRFRCLRNLHSGCTRVVLARQRISALYAWRSPRELVGLLHRQPRAVTQATVPQVAQKGSPRVVVVVPEAVPGASGSASGSRTVKRVPFPTSLSTSMRPPCLRTMEFEIDKPSP